MSARRLEVFFDGDCSLCRREIALVQRLDRRARIRFTDIADPRFDPAGLGRTHDDLMTRIHARAPSDDAFVLVEGVEVFRRMYEAVGFGPLVVLSRLAGLRTLLDLGYRWFAKNRLRLTGRCANGTSCSVH